MVPGASESHELQRTIDALHSRYKPLTDGDVATYIPELTKANPERLRHLHRDRRGRRLRDRRLRPRRSPSSRSPSRSPSAWRIEDLGAETVAKYVGVEPSGDVFNSIELHERHEPAATTR